MADQELTDLSILAVLATDDLFFVRDTSAGIDKQVAVSSLISLLPPKDLGDLGDVDLTTSAPSPGDHLEFDGTDWVPGSAGGGTFLSLGDTPGAYTGAAGQFLKVNATPDAVEFAALTLGDLPAIGLDDLTDVDVTTTTPLSGDCLAFNGSLWVPTVGLAPGAHAVTHLSAGTDEIDGDRLDIDFVPINYTRSTAPAEVSLAVELTAHLAGIDAAIGGGITTFLGHTDTPGSYAGAGSQFVRVNSGTNALEFAGIVAGDLPSHSHVEADITDLQSYVLPADSIDILADVDTTTLTPNNGDVLAFNGTNWIPASAMAPGAHASTHVSLGSDEIDGDVLDIDFVPSNYTRDTSPGEVTTVVELTAHLAGIDTRLGGTFTPSSHTHVEADITDLQTYLLNITGEDFTDLSDTPGNYTGSGAKFVQVNLGENALVFVDLTSGDLPSHTHVEADITDLTKTIITQDEGITVTGGPHNTLNFVGAGVIATDAGTGVTTITIAGGAGVSVLDDLSDVTISGVVDGELLRFNGSIWINNTLAEAGVAATSHSHVEADITDLQSYLLNITGEDFTDLLDTPANYTAAAGQFVKVNATPDALVFATLALGDLPAIALDNLSDVSAAGPSTNDVLGFNGSTWVPQAPGTPGSHASTHESGSTDIIDGDVLDITFVPTNYTRDTSPAEVTSVLELTAHLAGIDTVLATAGGGIADRQRAFASTTATTTSLTFGDVDTMTLTTKDLGSSTPGNYIILFSAIVKHQTQKEFITFQILVDDVVKTTSRVTLNFSDADVDTNLVHLETGIINGKIIKVRWHQSKTGGQNMATILERALIIHAVPESSVVA